MRLASRTSSARAELRQRGSDQHAAITTTWPFDLSEPRGIAAGYAVPIFHPPRPAAADLLSGAPARLGRENVVTGATYEASAGRRRGHGAFRRTLGGGEAFEVSAWLIAADGSIRWLARRYREGPPNFAQRILWRGVSEAVPTSMDAP
jgi:hypothetical protein